MFELAFQNLVSLEYGYRRDVGVIFLGSTGEGVHKDGEGVANEGVGGPSVGSKAGGLATAGDLAAGKLACLFLASNFSFSVVLKNILSQN